MAAAESYEQNEHRRDEWVAPADEADGIARLALLQAELKDFETQHEERSALRFAGDLDEDDFEQWEIRWTTAKRHLCRHLDATMRWLKLLEQQVKRETARLTAQAAADKAAATKARAEAEAATAPIRAEADAAVRLAKATRTAQCTEETHQRAANREMTENYQRGLANLRTHRWEDLCQVRYVLEALASAGVDLGAHGRRVLGRATGSLPQGHYETWLASEDFNAWSAAATSEARRGV